MFHQLAVGYVETVTDVTCKIPEQIMVGPSHIQNPPVFSIMPTQTVFDIELFPARKAFCLIITLLSKIIGMNTFPPPVSILLFQHTPGELEPTVSLTQLYPASVPARQIRPERF